MAATYTTEILSSLRSNYSTVSTDNDAAAKHLLKGDVEIVIINDGMKTVPSYTSAAYSGINLSSSVVLRFHKL